jgi:DNA-binding MarR family transcriptional regulator
VSRLSHDVRRLAALRAFADEERVTQRSLARELGVSLGLSHALLRGLTDEKLITVSQGPHPRALNYAVTAAGRREIKRAAGLLALAAVELLAEPRADLEATAAKLKGDGVRRVLLCGDGPLADVAASALRNGGLTLAGIVARDAAGARVAGTRVRPLEDAAKIRCDAAVVIRREDAPLVRRRKKGTRVVTFLPKEKRRG